MGSLITFFSGIALIAGALPAPADKSSIYLRCIDNLFLWGSEGCVPQSFFALVWLFQLASVDLQPSHSRSRSRDFGMEFCALFPVALRRVVSGFRRMRGRAFFAPPSKETPPRGCPASCLLLLSFFLSAIRKKPILGTIQTWPSKTKRQGVVPASHGRPRERKRLGC